MSDIYARSATIPCAIRLTLIESKGAVKHAQNAYRDPSSHCVRPRPAPPTEKLQYIQAVHFVRVRIESWRADWFEFAVYIALDAIGWF